MDLERSTFTDTNLQQESGININLEHKILTGITLKSQPINNTCNILKLCDDKLSHKYILLYESLSSTEFKKEKKVFDDIIKHIMFTPKIKSDAYVDKINNAVELDDIWTQNIVMKKIMWTNDINIAESDLVINK